VSSQQSGVAFSKIQNQPPDGERELTEAGAKVRLETDAGGHGWRGDLYGDIRRGIEWLEKNRKPADSR
jgi:hypothetical protein